MATQDDDGIPFAIHHLQQSFRLLELPPQLLGAATAKNPPRTYQVRQVHSSNSIFVLQPSEIASDPSNRDDIPVSGLSAIAQCATTLELTPVTFPATALLRNNLHAFNGPQIDSQGEKLAATIEASDRRSKSAIYKDMPLSMQEFENAWIEFCAFESDFTSWIPTASCLCGVWRSVISAVVLKGLNLQDSVLINDLVGLVEEDGFPAALLHAVVERLQTEKTRPMDGWATLSADKCVPWIGAMILASETAPPEGIDMSYFLQQWQNLLPEAWRQRAALGLLSGKYSLPSKGRILPKSGENHADTAEPAQLLNASGRKPGKWHEKFKNSRR